MHTQQANTHLMHTQQANTRVQTIKTANSRTPGNPRTIFCCNDEWKLTTAAQELKNDRTYFTYQHLEQSSFSINCLPDCSKEEKESKRKRARDRERASEREREREREQKKRERKREK